MGRSIAAMALVALQIAAVTARRVAPHVSSAALLPGDPAPAFELRTLQQDFVYPTKDGSAVVIHTFDSTDAFSAAMWSSNFSVDSFLIDMQTVDNTSVIIVGSTGGAHHEPRVALDEVTNLQTILTERTVAMGWSPLQSQMILSRIAFATEPVDTWAAWIPATLAAWPQNVTTLQSNALAQPATRLDGEYSVYPWPEEPSQGPTTLQYLGEGCPSAGAGATIPSIGGAIGLMSFAANEDGYPVNCSFANMTMYAQSANASAVVLFPSSGNSTPIAMPNCSKTDDFGACAADLAIPPTTVAAATGNALREAMESSLPGAPPVTVTLADVPAPAKELVILASGTVQEAGWRKFASLRFLSWSAQFADYQRRLAANLSEPTVATVNALSNATVHGRVGAVANVSMPPVSALQAGGANRVVVDFALGCTGLLQESCPVWDRIMKVTACCRDTEAPSADCAPFELARYITPFRRGVGRWLTDVSPLSSLLLPAEHSECGLEVQTDWYAPGTWTATASIRFEEVASPLTTPTRPATGAVPGAIRGGLRSDARDSASEAAWGMSSSASFLFNGGKFGDQYNNRTAVTVPVPQGAKRVLLMAVITGHGSDSEGCAEFCPTSHVFQVGGSNVSVSFDDAGTFWGSTGSVLEGTIPNQHGTWQYGRDGWYDGNAVREWRQDVTDLVLNGGADTIDVRYWGLFKGQTPVPSHSSAYIDAWSWLVWYD